MKPIALASLSNFGFLLLPGFSMIALSGAIEALRAANLKSGTTRYSWSLLSDRKDSVTASNGLTFECSSAHEGILPDVVFVCGGIDVQRSTTPAITRLLRELAGRRCALGSLCTGTYALAKANVLDGYRCTVHWAYRATLNEEWPDIRVVDDLFVIDKDRLTCSGGIAPIDMMSRLIRARCGPDVARAVAHQLIMERVRGENVRPQLPVVGSRTEGHRLLEAAISTMELNVETPLPITDIAQSLSITDRQLERIFDRALGISPVRFYLRLRLRRARALLAQTGFSAAYIALACGFRSPSHFSNSYHTVYGMSPSRYRAGKAQSATKGDDCGI
ncbi:GlxA family transcriptional regulator [Paraburkholderia sp. DGU8]|jgi:transcriptional regulator GlxA family with amidase domain|uniref:GlxA family transcriptional regulator n=1 Tax=Paraburkholderia sp. DGU8 TaxID=3161997 RepID=UPI003466C21F